MTLNDAYRRLNTLTFVFYLPLNSAESGLLSLAMHDLHVAIYEANQEHDRLRELIRQAHRAGRRAVDAAHKEFGYDSLRFADVRHGWLQTIEPLWDEVLSMEQPNKEDV